MSDPRPQSSLAHSSEMVLHPNDFGMLSPFLRTFLNYFAELVPVVVELVLLVVLGEPILLVRVPALAVEDVKVHLWSLDSLVNSELFWP